MKTNHLLDITELLHFIDRHREPISLFRFDVYLTRTDMYFTDENCEIYRFELPPDLAQDIADAYRKPGRMFNFGRCVNMYGIGPAENVMLGYSRRRKLALLLEV